MPLACSRSQPGEHLEQPTGEQLAARPNAVGVPYHRYILIRHRDRLTALRVEALSAFGERVAYDWYRADSNGRFTATEGQERGRGETAESPHTGRITVPDGPSLEWSRGSQTSGWLYWPDQGSEVEFYSLAFGDLGSISEHSRGGRWLKRSALSR